MELDGWNLGGLWVVFFFSLAIHCVNGERGRGGERSEGRDDGGGRLGAGFLWFLNYPRFLFFLRPLHPLLLFRVYGLFILMSTASHHRLRSVFLRPPPRLPLPLGGLFDSKDYKNYIYMTCPLVFKDTFDSFFSFFSFFGKGVPKTSPFPSPSHSGIAACSGSGPQQNTFQNKVHADIETRFGLYLLFLKPTPPPREGGEGEPGAVLT